MDMESLQLRNCAPEDLFGVVDSTQMEQRFLPGGVLEVDIDRVYLGHAVVQRGRYGMGVLARGAWPDGHVCLGFVRNTPSHATVNGFLCPTMSLQLYSEGTEVSYRAPPGSTWFAYCVKRDTLQEAVTTLYDEPLPIPQSGSVSACLAPLSKRRLADCIDDLFIAASGSPAESSYQQIRALETRMLYEAARAVVQIDRRSATTTRRHAANRRRLIAQAEDYLRANIAEPFVLGQCARAIGCSERMLERHFRAIYGVAPGAWFRCMKLEAVRRDLRYAGRRSANISDIAANWGFTHFGRFSVEYRRLFGETPSESLRK
tara:strand:- start:199 stop:1149 length:951 start_codon:yes stop_codon:yes gene_type:complete